MVQYSPKFAAVQEAVVKSSGDFKAVMTKVLTVEACQLVWFGAHWVKSMHESTYKTSVTSQVQATRENVMEWRSCLQFASQWHGCSLQGAYSLWQQQLQCSPACPANQWMQVASGQPMIPSDAQLAAVDLPSEKLAQLKLESSLTTVHELWVHCNEGVRQFTQHEKEHLQSMNELYWEFAHQSSQFSQWTLQQEVSTKVESSQLALKLKKLQPKESKKD